ncbi:MAG: hypothetical protein MH204_03005, partial [Fimbriimonadaceae bacterium]|nr:hypothetical protein [Fimbriimonadaceae bacterium]
MARSVPAGVSGLLAVFVVGCAAEPASAQLPADDFPRITVLPLTSQILMVEVLEGRVVYHKAGENPQNESVIGVDLDVARATATDSYTIASPDDPAFGQGLRPSTVGRKSKGTAFAAFIDRWEGRTVNDRKDHVKTHLLYLFLPEPMERGKTYRLATGALGRVAGPWEFKYDEAALRSEAVHVNLVGYRPEARRKIGYVQHWMGDRGGLNLAFHIGRGFRVLDAATGAEAFAGRLRQRTSGPIAETLHETDTPFGSFVGTEVLEADFSALTKPGRYVLAVDGVGRSFPFAIAEDVYRETWRAVTRALYHNRSGIELKPPYT